MTHWNILVFSYLIIVGAAGINSLPHTTNGMILLFATGAVMGYLACRIRTWR